VLRAFQDRLWLPHRAATEFLRHRIGVIGNQEGTYDDAWKSLEQLEIDLKNKRPHPFVSDRPLEQLLKVHDKINKELTLSKEVYRKRMTEDALLMELENIFRGRIGPETPVPELDKICAEGEQRYKRKIPPGYKDASKDAGEDPTRPYGDLILWKQILEKSKAENKSIIFVLDDRKEDWWTSSEAKRSALGQS